jgi:hypothetical protein
MATIRNPQQVGHTSRDDTRIEGARDIESHHTDCIRGVTNPLLQEGENQPACRNSLDSWWVPKPVCRRAPYGT